MDSVVMFIAILPASFVQAFWAYDLANDQSFTPAKTGYRKFPEKTPEPRADRARPDRERERHALRCAPIVSSDRSWSLMCPNYSK
jgi:hypothetical protein